MPPEETPEIPSLPYDIDPPESFLPGTPWWVYALYGLLIIFILTPLVLFLWKKLRSSKAPPLPERNHLSQATTKLSEIETDGTTGEVATQCSLIIRDCLFKIYHEPVLFETDEEIKLRPDSLAKVPPGIRPDFIELLETLGEEKYAPSEQNETRSQGWIDQSTEILRDLQNRITEAERSHEREGSEKTSKN